jgi:hypothetical protein
MSLILPSVGTSRLLELLSPYVPDDFMVEVCPRQFTGGRRHALSAAQLWRTHLLAGLTTTHSLNLVVVQLPEQVAWRRFARFLSAPSKQAARAGWQSAVVTKLRADMKLVPPYASAARVECPQGQRLEWWEYEPESGQQWFRVPAEPELCAHCWQAAHCPGHFGYAADAHETLLGLVPLASRVAQRLLRQVRPWIEPAQSFEKNQLGLGQMFFNSLRLTWQMSLWADSAVLLRTMLWLDTPMESSWLGRLQPKQLKLELPLQK